MSNLRQLCLEYTHLDNADIAQLERVEQHLSLMASLTNADVFIDCLVEQGEAIVVAHASPVQGISAYQNSVVGEMATAGNEPAVFHALNLGMPVCDLKAITQEGRLVRQNVVPIRNKSNHVIAVLIREKDVSENIQHEKKYEELARNYEAVCSIDSIQQLTEKEIVFREVHHRVKNNLQLVGSILNLQARKIEDPRFQRILKESVNRILSIASIHDILTNVSSDMQTIKSDDLLNQLRYNLKSLLPTSQKIQLEMGGDAICMNVDIATSVALVVVELVMNSIRHAFVNREYGRIAVSICAGNLFHTVTVTDDGTGFDLLKQEKNSLGLGIVKTTVEEKLKGTLHITSSGHGTKVSFDFKKE